MKMALTRIGKEKIRQLTPITEGGEGYIYEFGNDIQGKESCHAH